MLCFFIILIGGNMKESLIERMEAQEKEMWLDEIDENKTNIKILKIVIEQYRKLVNELIRTLKGE